MTAEWRAERRPGQGHAVPSAAPGTRHTAHTTRTRAITLAARPVTATVTTTAPPPPALVRLARP